MSATEATDTKLTPEQHLKQLKDSISAKKGWLTREARAARQSCDLAVTKPSKRLYDELLEHFDKVKTRYNNLEEAVGKVETKFVLHPTLKEYVDGAFEDAQSAFSEIKETLCSAISELEKELQLNARPGSTPITRRAGDSSNNEDKIKADMTLEPKVISSEYSPAELRQWLRDYSSFYTASNFEKADIGIQHSYFLRYVASDVRQRIENDITPNMPICAESDSCFQLLIKFFKLQYPVFNRRLDFFRLKQSSGESSTAFLAKLERIGAEADLADLTIADFYAQRILEGLADKTLRNRLLKLADKSFESFQEEMRIYDAAGASVKRLDGAENKTSASRNRSSDRNNKGKSKFDRLKGKCTRCARKSHKRKNCKLPDDIKCHGCGKKGHIKPACCDSRNNSRNNSRQNSRNNSKNNSRATSRDTSPETNDDRKQENKNASVSNRD